MNDVCESLLCVACVADVNAVDMYGVSAMHLAAENGHVLCLRALLDAGAACNAGTAEKRPQWVTTTGTSSSCSSSSSSSILFLFMFTDKRNV